MPTNNTNHSSTEAPTVAALQQRIAELEQHIAERTNMEAELHESEERFRRLTDNVPGVVYQFVLRPDGSASFPYVSEGSRAVWGVEPHEMQADAQVVICMIHPEDLGSFQETVGASALALTPWHWEGRIESANGEKKWIQGASRPQRLPDGTVQWDGLLLDITERKHAEGALRYSQIQEEIIQAQEGLLRELSTPLIPIAASVVLMPLIGTLDSRRIDQVITTLLEGIATQQARIAILDITGVPVVDTQVANAIIRAAQAVKLLGAQVVLTGIRPEVAQTMVGLGIDLGGIVTLSSLQEGITKALNGRFFDSPPH